ncbi:MAG: nucleotide sugar dehydrogenase [bacterium]|nr:nucleotide sugar dehydrogenase [bacterium]
MTVCVMGLWHLGVVTAACAAAGGHRVYAYDEEASVVHGLQHGELPVAEPGLAELVRAGVASGSLSFHEDLRAALTSAEVLWVTYDTPVDEHDRADAAWVEQRICGCFSSLGTQTLVVISSQLPVGTTRRLAAACAAERTEAGIKFAYVPENIRLGCAIEEFMHPERVVAGVGGEATRAQVRALFAPFTERLVWMSWESAEMTKHALNAFLATSVAFTNEVARICEAVGADAREVEQGLRSDGRIGPRAYVRPGAAFAGGTLARDVVFLQEISARYGLAAPLMQSVMVSNELHRRWAAECLARCVQPLVGARIAVWGLTYKPGTSTLRRSAAVELCRWLQDQGALVQVHDPIVRTLPDELRNGVQLCESALDAVRGADALVICTEWPEYREIEPSVVLAALATPRVIDANGFLDATLGAAPGVVYYRVGFRRSA